MGVQGFQTFVHTNIPEACRDLSLKTVARRYVDERGRVPIIVVDGMILMRKLYGKLDWCMGGQWQGYVEHLKDFVAKFHRFRIQPIFFFDGSVGGTKRSVWVERRKQKTNTVRRVFDHINNLATPPGRNLFVLPSNASSFTILALHYIIKATVYYSLGEADKEIVDFCLKNKCLGILTQDSDFMIFDTSIGRIFSAEKLNYHILFTVEYNVRLIHQKLGLDPTGMACLASALGNDVVSVKKLKGFHTKILAGTSAGTSTSDLVPRIADYILKKVSGWSSIQVLAADIFPGSKNSQMLFMSSVWSYLLDDARRAWIAEERSSGSGDTVAEASGGGSVEPELFQEFERILTVSDGGNAPRGAASTAGASSTSLAVTVVKPQVDPEVLHIAKTHHIAGDNHTLIYNVLSGEEIDSGESLEDQRNLDLPSSPCLYLPIKQYLFGLLLGVGAPKGTCYTFVCKIIIAVTPVLRDHSFMH